MITTVSSQFTTRFVRRGDLCLRPIPDHERQPIDPFDTTAKLADAVFASGKSLPPISDSGMKPIAPYDLYAPKTPKVVAQVFPNAIFFGRLTPSWDDLRQCRSLAA